QINGVPLTPPYKINAVGDPATLSTALNLPGGVGEMLKETDPQMIAVSEKARLELPAYAGAIQLHYTKAVSEESPHAGS
ncbi:MAG TPA: DUF881 domain-containing protein, partial [Capsulimonadaceae bacterium]|nr:DUF881 domain-containing protein [Capsulimonadaceae bacterium]